MPLVRIDETLETYYEIDDFTDPWKAPETMVLLHGNGRSCKFWYAWIPLLARQFRIVRPDYRGHGGSTVPPPGYELSFPGLAKDLKVLLDQLGLDRVHLVAEATGGVISMQFAHDYPERLKSLVLCGSAPANLAASAEKLTNFAEGVEKGGMEQYARSEMVNRFDLSKANPAHMEWYIEEMAKTSPVGDVLIKRLNAHSNLTGLLPDIKTPTLIMTGEKTAFGLHQFKEMHSLIPDSEWQVFYGAQHHVAHMYPEECVNSTLSFLRRQSL